MKVGVTMNPTKPAALEVAKRVLRHLDGRAEVVLSDSATGAAPEIAHRPLEAIDADAIVAIGGDGTFLSALRRTRVPLLPISAGTVGILAEFDGRQESDVAQAIDRLLDGRYQLEEPMKLAAQKEGNPLPDATNEYVVHSDQVGKMGRFEIAINGRAAGTVQADGLIVATPIGSTAYALSSLGPVVDPAVEGIVVTAIAPFRVGARAIVLDPLSTVTVRTTGRAGAIALADGEGEVPLVPGAAITIHRSPRHASFVRFGVPFFERLRGKRILPWDDAPAPEGADRAVLPPRP
jgi:NAD+ kinase